MGVRTAGFYWIVSAGCLPLSAVSPATDDKIIGIAIAMGISGGLMLICGCLGLAWKIRQKKEAEKAGKRGKNK